MKKDLRSRLIRSALVFTLFQQSVPQEIKKTDPIESDEKETPRRIRCPECKWEPDKTSLWYCGDCIYPEGFFDGCGTMWNTFDTAGRCPGCGHQWRWTSCLSCTVWSPHDDWYADKSESR